MARDLNRRQFVQSSLAGMASMAVWSQLPAAESKSPNEKLNIACIGVANRAAGNIEGVQGENLVAICDVDDHYLSRAAEQFPKAARYNDFRVLLDKEKTIDAVVVSTPDHTHAPAGLWAMQLGKHCYCEKPLTHSVHEARLMAQTAAQYKVATQLGTQIHAGENYRRVVEIVQSGALGPVKEAHVWVGKGWGGGERPTDTPAVPSHIHWDLWLGPAPKRPYHPTYLPANWRRWWDFGGGTLGDMGCHYMDLAFWALGLRHPTSIEAEGPAVHPETCPLGLIVRYEFPARGEQPPVKLTWYDGDKVPSEVAGHKVPGAGVMFVGEKGELFADYNRYLLRPEDKFRDYRPPEPTIPRSLGHHAEWIKACKDGSPTTCNFDYGGALTEAVLLGNVAFRADQRIEWDAQALKARNTSEADQYLRRDYRPGWTLG